MIYINKSKDKKFYVTIIGDNNEVLNTSEMLNTKQAAWVNIWAVMNVLGTLQSKVKDCTVKKPVMYVVTYGVKLRQ
jgi:uncharacterized protein YegP (UPF0339 family)